MFLYLNYFCLKSWPEIKGKYLVAKPSIYGKCFKIWQRLVFNLDIHSIAVVIVLFHTRDQRLSEVGTRFRRKKNINEMVFDFFFFFFFSTHYNVFKFFSLYL